LQPSRIKNIKRNKKKKKKQSRFQKRTITYTAQGVKVATL